MCCVQHIIYIFGSNWTNFLWCILWWLQQCNFFPHIIHCIYMSVIWSKIIGKPVTMMIRFKAPCCTAVFAGISINAVGSGPVVTHSLQHYLHETEPLSAFHFSVTGCCFDCVVLSLNLYIWPISPNTHSYISPKMQHFNKILLPPKRVCFKSGIYSNCNK